MSRGNSGAFHALGLVVALSPSGAPSRAFAGVMHIALCRALAASWHFSMQGTYPLGEQSQNLKYHYFKHHILTGEGKKIQRTIRERVSVV